MKRHGPFKLTPLMAQAYSMASAIMILGWDAAVELHEIEIDPADLDTFRDGVLMSTVHFKAAANRGGDE